ncbi:hypothetical protein ACH5RR_000369 [Cinchona calisaya]|uniref:RNase H type-1 domain-containing protein n=1 Tax=Cinchona calisaya TaxID=153742 RepID=A0ABD3B162_9GENT
MLKWSAELFEFDIEFRPRTAINAQAFADFIAESCDIEKVDLITTTDPAKEQKMRKDLAWELHVDGVSCESGAGAGIIIRSPEGDYLTYALRFGFKATNNEAEYEALICGMEMAHQMGARTLKIHSDSQLIVNQSLEITRLEA